jgi:(4-alkanoyl-5-oxo-2,5-dihydrofuran-3-yl)methyl phosphate reductase
MILVTGASGTVGSEVVRQLAAAGQKVRAMVRDPKKVSFGPGVEVVRGDFSQPETLSAAVQGVEKVFSLASGPEVIAQEPNLYAAAKRAGVKHIVKLSVMGADFEPGIALGRWHRASEKQLEASGVAWTILRPAGFMSNAFQWLGSIKGQGAIYAPTGQGKQGLIDPRDIAAVAVKALTTPGHEGQAYPLANEALTTGEQAALLSEAIGKPVQYVDVPEEAARQGMSQAGMPPVLVDAVLEFMGLIKAGYAGATTDAFTKITGQPPRTFAAWARENAPAFR